VANSLVQFSIASATGSSGTVAVFSPAPGNGLTDSNGQVTVALLAAGAQAEGAATITATATGETGAPSAQTAFQVGVASITLENPTLSPATIGAFQTSSVSVTIGGVPASVPVSVSFASPCAASGLASLPASVVSNNGVATATYTDKGCSGQDAITISAAGATPAQASLNIQPAPATAIQFVSASPDTIAIGGTGGVSSSVVTFKVVNAAQQPVVGASVTMSLSTQVGGVLIDNQPGPVTKQTGPDGTVSATVVAGTQPGPVRVVASAADGLSAVSSLLTIQVGLPTQNRFSLSIETFNIEGLNIDGVQDTVTIRVADRVGNPVPDDTTINFRTSIGAGIQASCRTVGGACSVQLTSLGVRPSSGRVAILAWAIGEESFQDLNGNNRFDVGEPFGDLGDAFVDANLDGAWQSGEEFIPFNPAATSVCAAGALAAAGRPGSCDGVWGLAHVRDFGSIVLSGSAAFAANLPGTLAMNPPACATSFNFNLTDINGNPMPAGSTVAASGTGVAATITGSPVPNTLSGTTVAVDLSASGCDGTKSTTLRIRVTTPLGHVTPLPGIPVTY
jgi:hypothetical protein